MKVREIREAYEELSSSFSKTARTLAISGIAIAWLFMPKFEGQKCMFVLTILAIFAFVFMLIADLLQNYFLSKIWYLYYIRMKDLKKEEDDEIKEPEGNNKIGWFLYHSKLWLLIGGYSLLAICFVSLIF